MKQRSLHVGMRRVAYVLVAVIFTATFTTPAGAQVSVPPQPDIGSEGRYLQPSFSFSKTKSDVPYGAAVNSRGELQTLTLDVFEPDNDSEKFRPVVVWVHGGFFARGSKSSVEFLHDFTRRGYVTVPINYRIRPEQEVSIPQVLGDPTLAPEFVETIRDAQHDALAAIRWVRANAAELRADPGRVIIAGHSAGGLTTFGAVFNHEDAGDSGNPGWPSRPTAGLASAGAYGSGITGRHPLPGDAPVLVMHGTHDTTVPMAASAAPCAQTLAVGNVCETRTYPGSGHGLPNADRGLSSTNFAYRHVISAARIPTAFSSLSAAARGETVSVTGRLTTHEGAPVGGARILGRATFGWVDATTDADGRFVFALGVPDHGRSVDVALRYEGHYTGDDVLPFTPHQLSSKPLAPTGSVIAARWGAGKD